MNTNNYHKKNTYTCYIILIIIYCVYMKKLSQRIYSPLIYTCVINTVAVTEVVEHTQECGVNFCKECYMAYIIDMNAILGSEGNLYFRLFLL